MKYTETANRCAENVGHTQPRKQYHPPTSATTSGDMYATNYAMNL